MTRRKMSLCSNCPDRSDTPPREREPVLICTVLHLELAKHFGEAIRLIGARDVERCFPDRDPAGAHDPNLDTDSPHGHSAFSVLPFAAPYIGHCVVHQGAKVLLQTVASLLCAPRREKCTQCNASPEFRDGAETHQAVVGEAVD